MYSLLMALSATFLQGTAAPVAPVRRLKDIPNIAISYHDLSQKDVVQINKALKKNKPLTPAQQALLAAKTNWTAGADMTRVKQGATCTVKDAKATFKATVDLPRFNEAWIAEADRASWQAYLSATEAQTAAKLWFAYDRLPGFEQALIDKPCDQAMKDGAVAMEKLRAEAAAFQPAETVQGAPAAVPAPPAH